MFSGPLLRWVGPDVLFQGYRADCFSDTVFWQIICFLTGMSREKLRICERLEHYVYVYGISLCITLVDLRLGF